MDLPPEILASIGAPSQITPMESGATSDVWLLEYNDKAYVFKRLHGRQRTCDQALDSHIRRLLKTQRCAVAASVLYGSDWMLDEHIAGQHPARGQISKSVCLALGTTLAKLHGLTVRGFGWPILAKSGDILGSETTPILGINTRFSNPVPDDLAKNPALKNTPALAAALLPHIERLRDALADNRAALCHSDLHERQFIVQGDTLMALIDFGGATIADPRWDMASLLYFHGPEVVEIVLSGYGVGTLAEAYLFSIGIALHHANRSVLKGKGHRLEVATAHLHRAHAFLSSQHATR